MSSILDRYGIKEVADVTFYAINKSTGKPTKPVLYFDTLKVSTIEQTAEEATANGGKGNAPLITWDYGKEINVTLQDALFSVKSMAIMFGGGEDNIKTLASTSQVTVPVIMRTERKVAETTVDTLTYPTAVINGTKVSTINPKFYNESGSVITSAEKGQVYLVTYDVAVEGEAKVIEIGANSFPANYYVTGDTYARSEASGEDEFFQFIIPKAKITSEHTLTMEADGDPSVFDLNLRVLRPADGVMMKLVKYDLNGALDTSAHGIYHNHDLLGTNA